MPNSPTGNNPRLIWTPARQTIWTHLYQTDDPLWQKVEAAATSGVDRGGGGTLNHGLSGAIAYQWSGIPAYAQNTWTYFSQFVTPPYSIATSTPPGQTDIINMIREMGIKSCVIYDWIKPWLSANVPNGIAAFYGWLNWLCDMALNNLNAGNGGPSAGTRMQNANGCVGEYSVLAGNFLATSDVNPRAGSFLSGTFTDSIQGPVVPVGGLDASGANYFTMRNSVDFNLAQAVPGFEDEGSEYQQSFLIPMLTLYASCLTALGVDKFPLLTQALPNLAVGFLNMLTPGQDDSYIFSDYQEGANKQIYQRGLELFSRGAAIGMLEGCLGNRPGASYLQALLLDWQGQNLPFAHDPSIPFYLLYDPTTPAVNWRTRIPKIQSGVGITVWRSGWTQATDRFVTLHSAVNTLCDHSQPLDFLRDFGLYLDGWQQSYVVGYGGIGTTGVGRNTLTLYGLQTMANIRGPIVQEMGNGYLYHVGQTYGPFYVDQKDYYHEAAPYFDPPPEFLHEWTGSILYVDSPTSPVFVVCDRTNSENPQSLAKFNRYRASDQQLINDAVAGNCGGAPKQWIQQLPTDAVNVVGNSFSWSTVTGRHVQTDILLPASTVAILSDLPYTQPATQPCGLGGTYQPLEILYQARVTPVHSDPQFLVFLNVVSYAPTAGVNSNVVFSDDSRVCGAHVVKPGEKDILALFSQVSSVGLTPQARILEAGYTVRFTATNVCTEVYLLDLDATKNWTWQNGGGAKQPFTPSAGGLFRLILSGSGPHVLTVATV